MDMCAYVPLSLRIHVFLCFGMLADVDFAAPNFFANRSVYSPLFLASFFQFVCHPPMASLVMATRLVEIFAPPGAEDAGGPSALFGQHVSAGVLYDYNPLDRYSRTSTGAHAYRYKSTN